MSKSLVFSAFLISVSILTSALVIAFALQSFKDEVHKISTGSISVYVSSGSTEGIKIAPVQVSASGALSVNANVRPNDGTFPVRQVTGPADR